VYTCQKYLKMLKYYVIVDFRSENNEGAGMGA
jgi:hypothetical protein